MVPKNMTHLLQPLDLTTNASFKKFEERAFSEYLTSSIMEAVQTDPARDATTVKVDLRLSTLKPNHARVMRDVYNYLRSEKGKDIIKAGWKAAGISDAVKTTRETNKKRHRTQPACLKASNLRNRQYQALVFYLCHF